MKYTTKQLAEICEVSPRAITKQAIQQGFSKSGKSWSFSDEQASLIISHFKEEQFAERFGTVTEQDAERFGTVAELQESLKTLEKQLLEQQEKISELSASNAQLLETNADLAKANAKLVEEQASLIKSVESLTEANRVLSADTTVKTFAEKKELLLADQETPQEPKKKGFWSRLFGL